MTKITTTRQLTNPDFLAILQRYEQCNIRVDSFTSSVKMIVVEDKVEFGIVVTDADFDGPVPVDGYYAVSADGKMSYLHDLVQPGALERAHFLGTKQSGFNELLAAVERWGDSSKYDMATECHREPNPPSSRHEVVAAGNGNYTFPRVKQQWRH